MNKTFDSELIINNDGSVYHLHLNPGDLARNIILVGDQERVPKVSKYFDRIELIKNKREFITHTGFIGKERISVISTGIGTDNIDIVLNEIDALFNVDFIEKRPKAKKTKLNFIRIGTTGSIHSQIPIDSFLVSEYALGLDGLLPFYLDYQKVIATDLQDKISQNFPQLHKMCIPYAVKGSAHLINTLAGRLMRGITTSATGFYAPQNRNISLASAMDDYFKQSESFEFEGLKLSNLEMETAGIYGLSQLLGHEAISFNGILANRKTGEFSTSPEETVNRLIELVLENLITNKEKL